MRIAVIGGGFFGTFLAYRLAKTFDVTLFEQGSELMNRSAILNPGRLHLGFSYPRCAATIAQSAEGSSRFAAEFGAYLRDVERNVYAIRKDGKSRLADLKQNLSGVAVAYEEVGAPLAVKDPENYEAFLKVGEKRILLDRLKGYFVSTIAAKVVLNAEVIEINPTRGSLKLRDQSEHRFDRVINATYTNPNLGLPLEIGFHFAYELAAMVCFDSNSGGNEAITVIDGDFVSLHPNHEGQDVLTSARASPLARPTNRMELEDVWRRRIQIAKDEKVMERILEDGKKYFELGTVQGAKLWIAPRTSLRANHNNGAPTDVRAHGKLISIFCGTLASVYTALDAVEKNLGVGRG